jgi:FMN reductase
MSQTRHLVVISAGLSNPSSTRLLADLLADASVAAFGSRGAEVEVSQVELRDLAHDLTDHLLTGFPSAKLAAVIDRVTKADGLVAVTPVFSASYSGLFKMFFDVLELGALDGKPVLVGATAGTARHSLVLEHALRPLFSYLHAVVVPTAVFAATEDFAGGAALAKRIDRAASELAIAVAGGSREAQRPTVTEQFALPTPFEELLRRASSTD